MENEKPTYYANIPANVRYDDDLRANEKLLYGEITALSNKHGECTASNNYFAKLYKVQPSAISRWVSDLKNKQYIKVEYIKNGKEIDKRIIRIEGIHKCDEVVTKEQEGYSQKSKGNNTSINNKENIYKRKYGEFENVLLSDTEYEKLKQQNLLNYIDTLSLYLKSKGKKYKNHYATILSWNRKEKKQTSQKEERRYLP